MSEFNFLTGRKELFDGAPDEAMVVLETHDGQIYYAVSHNRGARYWYDNGNPGRPAGLIALFEKTRVVASRARVSGLPKEAPKRDPIPKSRLDRMQQAQKTLRKAVSQPAPVKLETPVITPKAEPVKPAERATTQAHTSPCALCGSIGLHDCPGKRSEGKKWTAQDKQRLNEAVKQIVADEQKPKVEQGGFVSIFALGKTPRFGETFITLNRNGNIAMSSKLPFAGGDTLDIQIDPKRKLFRVGKVKTGGKVLPKARVVTSKALVSIAQFPKDAKSVRIELSEVDGWWQGFIELAEVPK